MKKMLIFSFVLSVGLHAKNLTYPIVDTNQERCYNNRREIVDPKKGRRFYGQDAQYVGNKPAYQDNKDGTTTDLVTGLMWSKAVNKRKVSLVEAKRIAKKMTLGGFRDWRALTIKELYSLIVFNGNTGSGGFFRRTPVDAVPFINTNYFDFSYGQVSEGERYIDAQWLSRTMYVSTTMNGNETLFGVNFADGRIKGYAFMTPRGEKKFYARYVRGGDGYGTNLLMDHGDGTITDKASGLTWTKLDSGKGMIWEDALDYAEKLDFAGYRDWRLPNAKELQSIVDYSRSPDTSHSAAIDPVFEISTIINEAGEKDFPSFWSSTTHLDGPNPVRKAVYVSFGRAMGRMHGRVMDVHGAGAQRSDPKVGLATYRGPQGDAIRIKNYVRCVRGEALTKKTSGLPVQNRRR